MTDGAKSSRTGTATLEKERSGLVPVRDESVPAEEKVRYGQLRVAVDITGKRFSNLVALYPTDKRSSKGNVIWHCRCDCGNEVDVSYNELVYTSLRSCGCMKQERNKRLSTLLTHVEGTSIDAIRSKKTPSNNTTGCRGVYFVRGKYMAKIVFQKKQYYLGAFENMQDAVMARQKAEEVLFDGFAGYYDQWKEYGDAHPGWAEENPIRILVSKDGDSLSVSITPDLPSAYDSLMKTAI